jgi:hypothetical protein
MEIGRVAWDFEFSEYSWFARVSEGYDEEWIDLLEGDEIETISDKTRRLEIFSWCDSIESTEDLPCG